MPGARGETWIDDDNQQHSLLFTNRALVEAEAALKRGILDILAAASGGNLSLTDVARLAQIGLEHSRRDRRDSRKPYTLDDALNLLDEYGFAAVAAAVFGGLAAVVSYNKADGDPPA